MELSFATAQYLIEFQDYLKKNDLYGFYNIKYGRRSIRMNHELGQFFEDNGIKFEDYFDKATPMNFGWIPTSWYNERCVTVPQHIKTLNKYTFAYATYDSPYLDRSDIMFSQLDATACTQIGDNIVTETGCGEVYLGKNLKFIDKDAFDKSSVAQIIAPETLDDKVKKQIEVASRYYPIGGREYQATIIWE